MTTLREEIKEIILDAIDESVGHAFQGRVYNPRITAIMNDLMGKIEKRIDSMYYDTDAAHISDDYDDGITFFFQQVKELLK